jgi:hypothetical protein
MTWRAQLAAIHSGDDCQVFGTAARGPCCFFLLANHGVGVW